MYIKLANGSGAHIESFVTLLHVQNAPSVLLSASGDLPIIVEDPMPYQGTLSVMYGTEFAPAISEST